MDIRRNDRRQMMLARLWIKSSCSTTRPPIAVTRLWRKRGLGVEVHLRQSGEAFDLRNADTSFLIAPIGGCGEQNGAFRVLDLYQIAAGVCFGHGSLLHVAATSVRICREESRLAMSSHQLVAARTLR
jgi:hypothetical protein